MSRIQSPVKDVNDLWFHKLPSSRKVPMAAAARVGNTHVFVDAQGKIYSTQVRDNCSYVLGSGLDDTLAGCRLLGLLSKDAVEAHTTAAKLRNVKRERFYAAANLADAAKTLGLKLTSAQEKALAVARAERG